MDSLISAAARALAAGDALGALNRVALRDDPPALALRGIAMAQLGEYPRARELLRRAARAFGTHEAVARARCVVAEAEVALAMRELGGSPRALMAAAVTLEARGDRANALQARLIAVRRLLLLGRLDEAAAALAGLSAHRPVRYQHTLRENAEPAVRYQRALRENAESAGRHQHTPRNNDVPPALAGLAGLAEAELALRSLQIEAARDALARAHHAAHQAGVPALLAEVVEARAALDRPAARSISAGVERTVRLDEVASLMGSGALIVDACRRALRAGDVRLPLARRPVLFAIARALAEAWPGDVDRQALIASVFNTRRPDETHRARLRVEIGRLRALVKSVAGIDSTARGFILRPPEDRGVVVLAPPIDGNQASLIALLSDGAAWSTSALALALDINQRTVQRALVELEAAGRVRSIGRARAQRWLSPSLAGFTTILLLPAALAP